MVDWEGGLGGFLYELARRNGDDDPGAGRALRERWEKLQLAHSRLGGDPGEILHVAFGFKYDIGPAKQIGFRTAWVNRKREERAGPDEPDFEWDTRWPLADVAG